MMLAVPVDPGNSDAIVSHRADGSGNMSAMIVIQRIVVVQESMDRIPW